MEKVKSKMHFAQVSPAIVAIDSVPRLQLRSQKIFKKQAWMQICIQACARYLCN